MLQGVQDLVLMGVFLQLEVQTHQLSFLKSVIFEEGNLILFSLLLQRIALLVPQVSKVKQMMLPDSSSRDGPVRPVIRTFYDHLQVFL